MVTFATTKLSTRGQIVIPESIRDRCGFEPGLEFLVIENAGELVFRPIQPVTSDFKAIMARARKAARKAGLKRSDVAATIQRVRAAQRAGR